MFLVVCSSGVSCVVVLCIFCMFFSRLLSVVCVVGVCMVSVVSM